MFEKRLFIKGKYESEEYWIIDFLALWDKHCEYLVTYTTLMVILLSYLFNLYTHTTHRNKSNLSKKELMFHLLSIIVKWQFFFGFSNKL